jgi:hypothetical protein
MCSGYERFRSLASATPRFHKRFLHTVLLLLFAILRTVLTTLALQLLGVLVSSYCCLCVAED